MGESEAHHEPQFTLMRMLHVLHMAHAALFNNGGSKSLTSSHKKTIAVHGARVLCVAHVHYQQSAAVES